MKIAGHLDLCGPSLIEGWLHCDAWRDEAIKLQVYIGGRLIGECEADRFRQDLQDAGYGTGRCGFSFAVPEDAEVADFADTRLRLVGTPVYLLPNEFTTIAPARQSPGRGQSKPAEDERYGGDGKDFELAGYAERELAEYSGGARGGDRQGVSFRAI